MGVLKKIGKITKGTLSATSKIAVSCACPPAGAAITTHSAVKGLKKIGTVTKSKGVLAGSVATVGVVASLGINDEITDTVCNCIDNSC